MPDRRDIVTLPDRKLPLTTAIAAGDSSPNLKSDAMLDAILLCVLANEEC